MAFDKDRVASCIRSQRARRRMSRDDLAAASGIPATTLACYENADSVMSLENAWRLADTFGMKMDELFERGTA